MITGSCVATCTVVTVSLATTSTTGTTCGSTVYGNAVSKAQTLIASEMILASILAIKALFF